MIGYLEGRVGRMQTDTLVLLVGGVGYQVSVPARLRETVRPGDDLALHVHTHVREDQLALFGFPSADELDLFRLLLEVEGLGPRSALQILSNTTVAAVRRAILAGDTKLLRAMPGVGPKTAARMVLELRPKIGDGAAAPDVPGTPAAGAVYEALTAMGYAAAEVREALAGLDGELEELPAEQAVATALRALDRR
jgi:Holliday junction DNA helicase RuvA